MPDQPNITAVQGPAPRTATASLVAGIVSGITLAGAVFVSLKVEAVGLVSLLRAVLIPLSLGAIVLGILARRSIAAAGLKGKAAATAGLVLGSIVLGLSIVTIIAVALFFSLFFFGR